jgi:hypothetical protein
VRASESHRSFATVAGEQAVRTELLCRKLHRLACKIVVFWLYPALAAAAIQYKSAVKVLRLRRLLLGQLSASSCPNTRGIMLSRRILWCPPASPRFAYRNPCILGGISWGKRPIVSVSNEEEAA